jgi:hypothetical protein
MLMRISFALTRQTRSGPLRKILEDGYPKQGTSYLPRPVEEELLGPNGLSFKTEDYSKLSLLSAGWFGVVVGGIPNSSRFNILRRRDMVLNRELKLFMNSSAPEALFFQILTEGIRDSFERLRREKRDDYSRNLVIALSEMKGLRRVSE